MTDIYLRYPTDGTEVLSVGRPGFKKLDLYKDENMEFISKVADISKLDKVFSDFSNSFTVPATPNNDEIFRFYYTIDVAEEYSYNPNIKVECYIEIDTIPYRFAAIQLEGVKIREGRIDSYSIGIFSAITQVSDLFGEDLLGQLDKDKAGVKMYDGLSRYNYFNTALNYIKSINDQSFNSGATLTPMINMSDKKWQLHGTPVSTDAFINIQTTPFDFTATRPAFRIIHII